MFKFKTVLLVASVTLASFSTLAHAKTDTLIVAGGCFWCVESDFEGKTGVLDVVSGYTGGTTPNPTYKQVSHTETGHFEAVQISFDDSKVSLKELVDYYWRTIDPTDPQGQFCDKGSTYRTALFYQTEAQKQVFETSLQELNATKPFAAPVVTQLLPAKPFMSRKVTIKIITKRIQCAISTIAGIVGAIQRLKSFGDRLRVKRPNNH